MPPAMSYQLQAMSCKLQASNYEPQIMSYEISDTSYKLRDTRHKLRLLWLTIVRYKQAYSKITLCRPSPYIDRTQLIIKHLNWLMIARYKGCTIPSLAGVDLISKLKLQEHPLQNKMITSSQLQYKCC